MRTLVNTLVVCYLLLSESNGGGWKYDQGVFDQWLSHHRTVCPQCNSAYRDYFASDPMCDETFEQYVIWCKKRSDYVIERFKY